MTFLFITVLAALVLDLLLGEAKRYHPLVGFGSLAARLERVFNCQPSEHKIIARCLGCIAYLLAVIPIVLISWVLVHSLNDHVIAQTLFSAFVLYVAMGWRSLLQHAKAISNPLKSDDLQGA